MFPIVRRSVGHEERRTSRSSSGFLVTRKEMGRTVSATGKPDMGSRKQSVGLRGLNRTREKRRGSRSREESWNYPYRKVQSPCGVLVATKKMKDVKKAHLRDAVIPRFQEGVGGGPGMFGELKVIERRLRAR